MMNSSFGRALFERSFTRYEMLMILGVLAVSLVQLPSVTEGENLVRVTSVIRIIVSM